MWRFVRAWRAVRTADDSAQSGELGPWAATVISFRQRELLLAVESRTYLTLVFALGSESTFPTAWRRALRAALDDIHVADARAADESCPKPLRLQPLVDDRLAAMLADVEFVCGTELPYHADLRIAQRRLNEFPYNLPPDYAPTMTVRRLFRSL